MDQTTQKPIFYVFSGIERTLISQDWIRSHYSGGMVIGDPFADKNCIEALDYLLENLEQKYDVKLVITSKKRHDPGSCENFLKTLSHLKYDKPIFYTKFVAGNRGEKILDFLEEQNASPLTYHTLPLYARLLNKFKDNPDFKNYVVIDGGAKKLSRYIPDSQLVKVGQRYGFTKDNADKILNANGIEISKTEEQISGSN